MQFQFKAAEEYAQINRFQRELSDLIWAQKWAPNLGPKFGFRSLLDVACGSGDITKSLVKWNAGEQRGNVSIYPSLVPQLL